MIHLLTLTLLLLRSPLLSDDTTVAGAEEEVEVGSLNSLHVVASAFGSLGSYSTDTRSRSASAYLTLSNEWRDYYTFGFASLWLARDNVGGTYYSQELIAGRASWLLGYRTNLFLTYAYLHESEIALYSSPATFHFAGGGGSYWLSPTEQVGSSATISLSGGKLQTENLRGFVSLHVGAGIWATSTATLSKAKWTPLLFVFRQSVSLPLWGENYCVASADFGRHAFYLDDDLLLVYNQRDVQTGSYFLKSTIRVFDQFYVVPSIEHNVFDDYRVTYGSLGVKMVF